MPYYIIIDTEQLPPRLQGIKLRIMCYTFHIVHVSGRELYTTDTLSCAYHSIISAENSILDSEMSKYINTVVQSLPASDTRLKEIRLHHQQNDACIKRISCCDDGWPDRTDINGIINQYLTH